MIAVVITGVAAVLAFWGGMAWASSKMQEEFQSQLNALTATVQRLQQDVADCAREDVRSSLPKISHIQVAPVKLPHPFPVQSDNELDQVFPDTPSVIAATISAMLGHGVKIRTIKLVDEPDSAANWVAQGRIAVQNSHIVHAARD